MKWEELPLSSHSNTAPRVGKQLHSKLGKHSVMGSLSLQEEIETCGISISIFEIQAFCMLLNTSKFVRKLNSKLCTCWIMFCRSFDSRTVKKNFFFVSGFIWVNIFLINTNQKAAQLRKLFYIATNRHYHKSQFFIQIIFNAGNPGKLGRFYCPAPIGSISVIWEAQT